LTAVTVGRVPIFTDPDICRITLTVWDTYRKRWMFSLIGYVLMPDHFHLLAHFSSGADCLRFHRDSNHLIARRVIRHLQKSPRRGGWLSPFAAEAPRGSRHRVWAERPRNLAIDRRSVADQKLQYIHMNPVRHGLVEDPCDWPWSSARNYLRDDHSVFRVDVEALPLLD
jgi:REP element-mobilizing transposase RayT